MDFNNLSLIIISSRPLPVITDLDSDGINGKLMVLYA